MATMKDMFSTCLEKIERQAKKIGRLEDEVERYEKLAATWEERALKAEAQQPLSCSHLPAEHSCGHIDNLSAMLSQARQERDQAEHQHRIAHNAYMEQMQKTLWLQRVLEFFGVTIMNGEAVNGNGEVIGSFEREEVAANGR